MLNYTQRNELAEITKRADAAVVLALTAVNTPISQTAQDIHTLLDMVRDLDTESRDVQDIVIAMCRLHALRHYHLGERLNELWSKLLVVADIDLAELLPSRE